MKTTNEIFFLITIALFLATFLSVSEARATGKEIAITLSLLSDKFTSDRENVPRDFYSIRDGMSLYPPRVTQLTGDSENAALPSNQSGISQCGYTKARAFQVLESIEKAVVKFYGKTAGKDYMRADAGYGLRLLGGQLNLIISKAAHSKELKHLQRYFVGLAEKAMALGDNVIRHSISDDSITDKSLERGIKLMLERDYLLHPKNLTWHSAKQVTDHLSEFGETKIGDELEVVYGYLDFHCRIALVSECDVPLVCRKMYLEDIYAQYMLTHQFLYLQYANKAGCVEQKPEVFKDIDIRMDRICSKMYLEAEFLEKHSFPTRYMDLFAEQVGFCGLAGYPNFLREDWLREILSWQSKSDSGCFIDHYKNARLTDAIVKVKSKMPSGEVIEEDCLEHLTSVGMMALAVNLRRIVDTCPEEYFRGYEPRYWNL